MDPSFLKSLFTFNLLNIDLQTLNSTTTVMGMPDYVVWIIIAILLFVSALYSASENTYTNCNKYHFLTLSKEGSFTAKLITRLIEKFDNTLITVLVGNNIIQTLMSFLSAMLFYNLSIQFNWATGLEAILSTVVMAVLVYVVSDTVPKVLSKAIPDVMAYILVYPVTITNILLYPIILIFKGILVLVHKIFRLKDENLLSKEDIIHQAEMAVNEETTDEEESNEKLFEMNEKEILENAFYFDQLKVKDVYTKRENVTSLNITKLTPSSLNKALIDIPYSRIPIYENQEDNIIGILVLKVYFEEYVSDNHLNILSILEDVVKINENMPIDDAFKLLNKEKVHLGVVYNDKNEMLGIISMEDILEELVDDIDESKNFKVKKVIENE